jgi:hypothetical protein
VVAKSWVGLAWSLHLVRRVCGGSPQNHQGYLVKPQNQDRRLGGRRRDPGTPIIYEAGDTRHDRVACIGRTRRPYGCAVVRWRTSCVDQNPPLRACVITPSAWGTSILSRGPIYRRRGLNFQPTLWLEVGVLFHFWVHLGKEGERCQWLFV